VRELPDHEFPADAIAVCIDYALPNSPADAAGLREGDVIVRVGGEYFTNLREFRRRFAAARLDSPLGLTVVRDEGPHEESVVVATMPVAPPILPAEEQWGIRLWCGLADELTNDPRREGEHVIVVHEIRNPALAGGLRVGDAIMALDGAPIRSLGRLCRELTVRLASPPCERVTLTVRSPHGDRPVSLPLIPAGERGASDR
jgi:S1-C subfamily serine protease